MVRKKKFDQEHGSIDSMLSKMPKAIQRLYAKNRKAHEIDQKAMERWAHQGYSSGDETVHSAHDDVLG